ncbi:MAG: hypothetical protein ACLVJ6_04765 [Merdibacter sp.]
MPDRAYMAGHTHLSMAALGGCCFLMIGRINEDCPSCVSLLSQMVLSALVVTAMELPPAWC